MRKIIMFNMVSLDGLFEGPDGNIDWHMVDEEFNTFSVDQLNTAGGLIFGRRTYELMASYWPTPDAAESDPQVAEKMKALPKYVVTRTLSTVPWANSYLIKGDAAEELRKIQRLPGNDLYLFGSADLASTLIRQNMIDEYRIIVNPVILGQGRPLFADIPNMVPLHHCSTRTFRNGNTLLIYQPDQTQTVGKLPAITIRRQFVINPANDQMEVGGATGKYADVNGLHLYYETHGEPTAGQSPLILLHGAFSATGTSFGGMLQGFAATRQVISVELQGHGRTADIDRPLRISLMADDIAALIRHLGLAQVDILGYSMGAGVALDVTVRYPQLVRKAIFISLYFAARGAHPGQGDNMGELKPEMLHGSPFHDEYLRTAPRPEDFPRLVAKVVDFNANLQDWSDEQIRAIQSPVMVVIGDSDIVQPEHAVEMFRLLGGGVIGDLVGLPRARLAILPGTTHVTVAYRGDWLVPMVTEFLDTLAS